MSNDGFPALPPVSELAGGSARSERIARGLKDDEPEVAAKKMEALFATMLVKELRRALPNGFFGDGEGSDVFEGWFDEHMGEALAADGALDLAGFIKASLGAKHGEASE